MNALPLKVSPDDTQAFDDWFADERGTGEASWDDPDEIPDHDDMDDDE